ncbi:MAG: hypothetical protein ISS44_04935 [Candidatus Omnitrophica bacterium]|nr:hypothetical protein [Candidatus Omnitrophota bacterium]
MEFLLWSIIIIWAVFTLPVLLFCKKIKEKDWKNLEDSKKDDSKKKIHSKRFQWCLWYLGISFCLVVISLCFFIFIKILFLAQYLYCLGVSLLGFFAYAIHYRNIEEYPFPLYVIKYPIVLVMLSLLGFCITKFLVLKYGNCYFPNINIDDKALFLVLAAPLNFLLAFFSDNVTKLGK